MTVHSDELKDEATLEDVEKELDRGGDDASCLSSGGSSMSSADSSEDASSTNFSGDSDKDEDDDDPHNRPIATVEHTGRWTREEHEAFLLGLKKYGKEWKKVAAQVRTRTVVQTRTHAQKYFQKLHKSLMDQQKTKRSRVRVESIQQYFDENIFMRTRTVQLLAPYEQPLTLEVCVIEAI